MRIFLAFIITISLISCGKPKPVTPVTPPAPTSTLHTANQIFYDNFQLRANTPLDSLGTATTGQTYRLISPSNANHKARVFNGGFISPEGETVYAFVNTGTPLSHMGMVASWQMGTGTIGQSVAMVLNKDGDINNLSAHFYTSYVGWTLQTRVAGGAFITVGQGTYPAPLKRDGTKYTFEVNIVGNTATILAAGTTSTATSDVFVSLKGNWVYFEHYYAASTSNAVSTIWEAVAGVNY